MNKKEIFTKGIIKENPVLVSLLGMCPTLAVTGSVETAVGMGVSVIFVLTLSNIIISLIRKIVPDEIRIPVYIVVIASLVTLLEMILDAYFSSISNQLGIFIPLIVVNCIILGRAEAFASKNTVFDSILDALGNGIGFTFALVLLGGSREILGNGSFFGFQLFTENPIYTPSTLFILPPGAFLMLGFIIAIKNMIDIKNEKKKAEEVTK